MLTISQSPVNYPWFLEQFRQQRPVTFSRWGDGEWLAATGAGKGANCDGHPYHSKLLDALQNVLRSRPAYLLALQPLMLQPDSRSLLAKAEQLLKKLELDQQTWYDGDMFHRASAAGELLPMFEVLRNSRLVVMGPAHLRDMTRWGQPAAFIEVPLGAAFEARQRMITSAIKVLRYQPYSILSVSAGMTAKVILHELHRQVPGTHALIDFGSLWDPYVGIRSRWYMRKSPREFV
jgi:hypothetical protein